ncbi:hypothetical protein O203_00055 [Ectopseudomonas chengduensis]|nr:hypothetical protein O203_00055 [Pseudomonas chengduensis]
MIKELRELQNGRFDVDRPARFPATRQVGEVYGAMQRRSAASLSIDVCKVFTG